ncbi:MAG: myo-inositol-1(or 4)-monophosphatase [Flavobacteriales bacterium]
MLATGFPYDDFGKQEEYLKLLGEITKRTRGVRRLGSAALDLAYVACGRCDLFYEYALNPWDVAAGILLVREAGGCVSNFAGEDDALFGEHILASNTYTHPEMLEAIQRYF